MTTYSIETGHGDEISSGIQNLGAAEETAQRRANRRSESVWLYSDDGDDGIEVKPEQPKVRIFRGDETKQIDSNGNHADPEKWYYEPSDYEGDVPWSRGYGSRAEAYHAAGCSQE